MRKNNIATPAPQKSRESDDPLRRVRAASDWLCLSIVILFFLYFVVYHYLLRYQLGIDPLAGATP